MNRSDYVEGKRREAWAFGRELVSGLMDEYQKRYDMEVSPPPAQVANELLTAVLDCTLTYAPLALNVFAQTDWLEGETLVTVNSNTSQIKGVKDAEGVQNVAILHECIHVVRDAPPAAQPQGVLIGFEAAPLFVCRRGEQQDHSRNQVEREFWAEEAGRAAAISYVHLRRCDALANLCKFGPKLTNGAAWSCIYESAAAIFVNVSALVTQLEHERFIVLEGTRVRVQPALSIALEPAT